MFAEINNLLDGELLVRTINREVETLIIIVLVRVVRVAVGDAVLVVIVTCVDGSSDLRSAVVGVAASGGLLAGLERKGNSRGCEQHGSGDDRFEEHFVLGGGICRLIGCAEISVGSICMTANVRSSTRSEWKVVMELMSLCNAEIKLVFDFLPVVGRPTVLDIQTSEGHVPRSSYLAIHW